MVDGLLEVDEKGKLVPCIAEEWGTEDNGLTWTFKIRQGVKWVDVNGNEMADCNAQDFAAGLEWVLNFHKNDSSNTSMPLEMIKGAREYYEYTKTLTKDEAYALNAEEGSKFREMVGLETPDDYTLVYHCLAAKPYFDSLATYNCLYPAPKALVDQMGPEAYRAINNETMWYNGCYTMTEYLQGNQKVYTKNPMYWDQDCTLFDTVTFKMTGIRRHQLPAVRKRRGRLCCSGRSAYQHHRKRPKQSAVQLYGTGCSTETFLPVPLQLQQNEG